MKMVLLSPCHVEAEQDTLLRKKAKKDGVSVAKVVRDALDAYLKPKETQP